MATKKSGSTISRDYYNPSFSLPVGKPTPPKKSSHWAGSGGGGSGGGGSTPSTPSSPTPTPAEAVAQASLTEAERNKPVALPDKLDALQRAEKNVSVGAFVTQRDATILGLKGGQKFGRIATIQLTKIRKDLYPQIAPYNAGIRKSNSQSQTRNFNIPYALPQSVQSQKKQAIKELTYDVTNAKSIEKYNALKSLRKDVTRGYTAGLPKSSVGIGAFGLYFRPTDKTKPQAEKLYNNVFTVANWIDSTINDVGSFALVTLGVDAPSYAVSYIPPNMKKTVRDLIMNSPYSNISLVPLQIVAKTTIASAEAGAFTKADLRRVAGQIGGTYTSVGSVFLGGAVGTAVRVISVLGSKDPVSMALTMAMGGGFGIASKFVRGGSGVVKVLLGTGKAGKVWAVAEKVGSMIIPAYFVVEGSRSVLDIGGTIVSKDASATKRLAIETGAGFSAFTIGAGVGEGIGGRFAKGFDTFILKRQFSKVAAKQYGKNSKTYKEAMEGFEFAFGKQSRYNPVLKPYDAKFVESISKEPRAIRIVNKVLRENANEFVLLGSGGLVPQTSLKAPPRGKSGDIDANSLTGPKGAEKFAKQLYNELRAGGYSKKQVKYSVSSFAGEPKFHVKFRASGKGKWKELLNLASSRKTTFYQIEQIVNTFDLPPQTAFRKDAFQIQMLNLRDQLRGKITGYATAGREKDLIDILAIVKAQKSTLTKAPPSLRAKANNLINQILKSKTREKQSSLLNSLKKVIKEIKLEAVKKVSKVIKKSKPVKIVKRIIKPTVKKPVRKVKTYKYKPPKKSGYAVYKVKYKSGGLKGYRYKASPKKSSYYKPSKYKKTVPYKKPSTYKKPPYKKTPPYKKIPPYKKPPYKKPPTYKTPPYKPPKKPPYKPPSKPPYKPPYKPPKKPPYKPPTKPPYKPPTRPPVLLPKLSFQQNINRLTKLKVPVNLYVRKSVNGKVKPVLIRKNMIPTQATALGRHITNTTPARTYFIRIAKKGKMKRVLNTGRNVSSKRFRSPRGKSQLELGSRIEKSKWLLDTKGEKIGITGKGIVSSKRKKLFGRTARRKPRKIVRRKKRLTANQRYLKRMWGMWKND